MYGYPLVVDLRGRTCVVVGGGEVGLDKARALLEAGASVLVVDPAPSAGIRELAASARISSTGAVVSALSIVPRPFRAEDLAGSVLVFACTGHLDVDASVLAAADRLGILACDSGTDPDRYDASAAAHPSAYSGRGPRFASPAVLRRGDLCVAVSSGGAAPALAADVRDRIAATIGPEFGDAAAMLAGLRERLRTCVRDLAARRGGLRSVLDGGLIDMLKDGRRADAIALCDAALESAKAAGGEPDRCTR